MDSPRGRVLTIQNDRAPRHAEVEVESAPACARCASGKGCGAGMRGDDGTPRRVNVLVPAGCQLSVGDEVRLELAPDSVLSAAFTVYGLPLAGAIVGAGVAYLSGLGDLGAATVALTGLLAGIVLGRARLRRAACLRRFTPTIVAQ